MISRTFDAFTRLHHARRASPKDCFGAMRLAMTSLRKEGLACLICLLSLSGCTAWAPPAQDPPVAVWSDPGALGLGPSASGSPLEAQWWRAYGSPTLDALMAQAVAQSPSLQVAQARWRRAAASIEAAEALNRPQAWASVDALHQRYTAKGLVPPPIAGSVQDTGTVQAQVAWEFDFFGKNQAALDAALGQAKAAQADAAAARIFLQTQVARTYLRGASFYSLLRIAQRTLAQRQEVLSLVRARFQAGLDSEVELKQAESALPDIRTQVEALQEQIELTHHALAALVGGAVPPSQFTAVEMSALRPLQVPNVLPADLLARRPDVLAAQWRVQAALSEQKLAQAQFYPNVNLVAFVGLSSLGLDRLLQSGSQQWGVGPALRLPLFDTGRLRANLQGKSAELDAAVHSYNAAVLDAVKEVVDPLTSLRTLAQQQAQQAQALGIAQRTHELARQRRDAGLTPTLQVLLAESNVLQQQRAELELQARLLDVQVSLVRALGAGFN